MKTVSIYDNRLEIEAFIKPLSPCKDFQSLVNSRTHAEWVGKLFMNYDWLKPRGLVITEIETITAIKCSKFYVWLLKSYCLGKDVDDVVEKVIELHKKVIEGEHVAEKDWDAAGEGAWSVKSAKSTALALARYPASKAASAENWEIILTRAARDARDAAWNAACDAAWYAARARAADCFAARAARDAAGAAKLAAAALARAAAGSAITIKIGEIILTN